MEKVPVALPSAAQLNLYYPDHSIKTVIPARVPSVLYKKACKTCATTYPITTLPLPLPLPTGYPYSRSNGTRWDWRVGSAAPDINAVHHPVELPRLGFKRSPAPK